MDEVRGGRGSSALYVGCVYMPTDSTSVGVVDSCYDGCAGFWVLERREQLYY